MRQPSTRPRCVTAASCGRLFHGHIRPVQVTPGGTSSTLRVESACHCPEDDLAALHGRHFTRLAGVRTFVPAFPPSPALSVMSSSSLVTLRSNLTGLLPPTGLISR